MNHILVEATAVRQQIERLLLDFPEISDDLTLLADTAEGETDLHPVLIGLVREQGEAGAYADAIRAQEKELASRRGRFERRQEMFRAVILSLMQTAQQQKLVLPEATLSVTNVPPKPIVDDETQIPDEFCTFNRWPNLSAIKTAVKAGENVPGVHMSNGGQTLTIRIK